jgi:hypothetical protein
MGIQTIINNATFINIDRRKVTASSMSRSGHYKTSERSPSPYSFTIGMHSGLKYSQNRDLIEDLNSMDRIEEANVSLNNNSNMNYLTNYLGDIETAQLNNITVNNVSGANIYISTSGATGTGTLFKKGDFIQPKGNTSTYRYPYQVTADVTFSVSGNITVPVHRPVLSQTGVALTSGGLRIGNDVRFNVKATVMPSYSILPHDVLAFDSEFELIEVIK